MDSDAVDQVLDELIPFLETLETQSSAVLLFLKAKGMATDEELTPYLEQAGNMSSVRWRAARVRMKSVFSSAIKTAEQEVQQSAHTDKPSHKPVQETEGEKTEEKASDRKDKTEKAKDENAAPEMKNVSQDKTRAGEEVERAEKPTEISGSKNKDAA